MAFQWQGVRTARAVAAGETIERAPVVVVAGTQRWHLVNTAVEPYLYGWGERLQEACLGLGGLVRYLVGPDPNARCERDLDARTLAIVALRDLQPGEPVVIDDRGMQSMQNGHAPPNAAAVHRELPLALVDWTAPQLPPTLHGPDMPIAIAHVAHKGRGMVAQRPLPAGTLIERAPVIPFPEYEWDRLDKTALTDYPFLWEPTGVEEGGCFALGYVSLYNHAYQPNAVYDKEYGGPAMVIKTLRAVAAGEELTINYNWEPDDQTPVWFDAVP